MNDVSGEILGQVSERISKELEMRGYSYHKVRTKSSEVIMQEFMENIDNKGKEVYSTGSNTEGVSLSGSDRDVMTVLGNVTVITSLDQIKYVPDNCTIFIMEQENVRPCYSKLKLVGESTDQTDQFHRLGGKERLCMKDSNGNWYFSSSNFTSSVVSSLLETFQSSAAHDMSSFHVHGPSATWQNLIGKHVTFDVDTAYCLRCPFLPRDVSFRPYQKDVLKIDQLFKKMGCHIVPVGDKASVETHLEWRVSYALIERELIWNFNDIQVKCYVLLKAILKEHIQNVAEDELSSYAIKTCLFWIAETEDASVWKEEKLLQALQLCLGKLFLCVKEKIMPHFIIPGNNILLTKLGDEKIHSLILKRLQSILEWHWTDFLKLPPLQNLRKILETVNNDVHSFLRSSRCPNVMPSFYKDLVSFRSFQRLYINIHDYSKATEYYTRLQTYMQKAPVDVDNLQRTPAVIDHLQQEHADDDHMQRTPAGVGNMRQAPTDYSHLQHAPAESDLLPQAPADCNVRQATPNDDHLRRTRADVENPKRTPADTDHLQQAPTDVDHLQRAPVDVDHLQRARTSIDPSLVQFLLRVIDNRIHFMTKNGNLCSAKSEHVDVGNHFLRNAIKNMASHRPEQSLEDVKQFLSEYKLHVLYIGLCGPEEISELEKLEYLCYVTSAGDLTSVQKIQQCLAFDFVICKVDLVPPFLQRVLELWDEDSVPILIHPKIMAYYILVLALYQTGKIEEASLCLTMSLSENVQFADKKADDLYSSVAWCLLGHACFLMQKKRLAYRAFRTSLRRKLLANPALYFIGSC